MDFLRVILILIVAVAVLYGMYLLWLWVLRKRSATMVDSFQMNENIRRKQVIDVREPAEFDATHILGARNIPISQFKMRKAEVRKDQPVYLYDDSYNFSSRAAHMLYKDGHRDIFILKGGIEKWIGKTKSNI